jgi:hypothetical protein
MLRCDTWWQSGPEWAPLSTTGFQFTLRIT